jgi:hypothetical protein
MSRARRATLARERHQAIESALRSAEPREPARQDAAAQEPAERRGQTNMINQVKASIADRA